ncbi:uncharacterized protein LOC110990373 [Acanthaster planci]|uniref:Uncharacterized protein LOC110990373 n=1 Tax=Acanthaster planci TaxID=133434 RepID=A0A8B8A245_ACAPL|nr:uncharacterized protein LOC110990373 [Acanthaster planci]
MAYKSVKTLVPSLLLFLGGVTLVSLYNPCTQIGACPNVPSIYASPAWTGAFILLMSTFGLAISINGWEGKPVAGVTFLVLDKLGVLLTLKCVVLSATWQPQSLLAIELRIGMILVSLFLCAMSAVAFVLFLRDFSQKVQLPVVVKQKVTYRGAGGRDANVASVSGALPVGSRAGVGVSAPSTAQPTTTGLPVIPSGPEHIYSTRIADSAPAAE